MNEADLYVYKASVQRVIDGDTYLLDIDLGLHVHTHARVRLFGVNAPEIRGDDKDAGLAATARTVELLTLNGPVMVRTIKDRKEKYGRWLCHIVLADGRSLADVLISEGHAKPAVY